MCGNIIASSMHAGDKMQLIEECLQLWEMKEFSAAMKNQSQIQEQAPQLPVTEASSTSATGASRGVTMTAAFCAPLVF